MRCAEQAGLAHTQRWECTGIAAWDSDLINLVTVTIERTDTGPTSLVAVLDATATMGRELCPGCDPYTGFFANTVALAPITGRAGAQLSHWIDTHANVAWVEQFGDVAAMFRPTRPLMTMTITIPAD